MACLALPRGSDASPRIYVPSDDGIGGAIPHAVVDERKVKFLVPYPDNVTAKRETLRGCLSTEEFSCWRCQLAVGGLRRSAAGLVLPPTPRVAEERPVSGTHQATRRFVAESDAAAVRMFQERLQTHRSKRVTHHLFAGRIVDCQGSAAGRRGNDRCGGIRSLLRQHASCDRPRTAGLSDTTPP